MTIVRKTEHSNGLVYVKFFDVNPSGDMRLVSSFGYKYILSPNRLDEVFGN